MTAKSEDIPVIWWDPTVHSWPEHGEHGQRDQVHFITVGLPPSRRRYRGIRRVVKLWDKLCDQYPEMPTLPGATKRTRPRAKRNSKAKATT